MFCHKGSDGSISKPFKIVLPFGRDSLLFACMQMEAVGSEIVSRIYEEAFDYIDAPILRVAQKEVPLPYNRTLEQAALPQVSDIIAAVKEVLK